MRITILGASGKVGSLLTDELLSRGYEITALVHSKSLRNEGLPHLYIVKGDINSSEDIQKAIDGSEAVISTLGSWGSKSKDIVSTATMNLIPIMEQAGIQRFVSVTGGAARMPEEVDPLLQRATRSLLRLLAKPILFDAEEHLRLLSTCKLDWTAIRSPIMTNSSSKNYELTLAPLAPWATISRQAVVQSLVDVLDKNSYLRQSPHIIKA